MKISHLNHAALHAAHKQLEKILKNDADKLPHGKNYDVSGMSITITFPEGTSVMRASGENDDGLKERKATPMLYGRMVWGLLKAKLEKFHQWKMVEQYIIETLQELLERIRRGKTENSLQEELVKLEKYDEEWEAYLLDTFQDIPCLTCDTERKIEKQRDALVEIVNTKKASTKVSKDQS